MDIQGEINRNAVIVGDSNTPLTSMDRSSRQKINKETAALNDTLDQMDLIDIFRAFHPKAAEYTYFSSACGKFSRIELNLSINQQTTSAGKDMEKGEHFCNAGRNAGADTVKSSVQIPQLKLN